MSMRSGYLALVVSVLASVGQGATAYLGKDNFVSLDVRQSKQNIHINYPGHLSGVCGIQVRLSRQFNNDGEAKKVAEGLIVKDLVAPALKPIVGRNGVRYRFNSLDTYVTFLTVQTKSGVSLTNFFKSLSPQGGLENGQSTKGIVVATGCK